MPFCPVQYGLEAQSVKTSPQSGADKLLCFSELHTSAGMQEEHRGQSYKLGYANDGVCGWTGQTIQLEHTKSSGA